MAHKANTNFKFNEELRSSSRLQDKGYFDKSMDDDPDDIIVFMKDNVNQTVTMKKIQRCKVCLKIPNPNCLCKQKSASLRSNISGVSQMSFYGDASYGLGGRQVNN